MLKKIIIKSFLCTCLFSTAAFGDIVPAPYNGSRSTPTDIVIPFSFNWKSVTVDWTITPSGVATHPFTYTYDFSGTGYWPGFKNPNLFLIEVPNDAVLSDFQNTSGLSQMNIVDFLGTSFLKFSDPFFLGLKSFDSVTFNSLYAPVFGDFKLERVLNSLAVNRGFGLDPSYGGYDHEFLWVATPGVEVPEPTTMILLGSALGAAGFMRKRKKK